MPSLSEASSLEAVMTGGKRACCAFAMHPRDLIVHHLLPRDIMADEVDKIPGRSRQDFLERFQH